MKKILLIILLIVALPLYGYNALMLLHIAFPGSKKNAAAIKETDGSSFEHLLLTATPVKFALKGRDPFTLHTGKPKPAPTGMPVAKGKKEPATTAAPPITITGILWNPDNPVAMIKLSGGKTTLAKAGQRISDNLIVKRVEKKTVTVVFGGKEFTIERR